MSQNYGLGRGLSSLIPQKKIKRDDETRKIFDLQNMNNDGVEPRREKDETVFNQGVLEVDINKISTNPYQPRIHFDEEKLKELSDSIKVHGILQPLVVTRNGDKYELVAGERRWQAAKIALLLKVPVIVKNIEDKQKLELAIVENIQRHNLNPIEEAQSFQQLIDEFQMSQEEVARKMGKSRSVIANKVRLLNLPVEALKALREGIISEGHAKAILAVENLEKQRALLDLIIKNHWTVRQVESKAKEISVKTHRRIINNNPEIKELEDKLSALMGTKVRVTKSGGDGGKVIIDYYSKNELEKIINNLSI
jgi:ParB family chromosome partitioning protein